jgi:hypothetical protein
VNQFLGLREWPDSDPTVCHELCQYIREILTNAVHDIVSDHSPRFDLESIDRNRARYVPITDFVSTRDIYLAFSPAQYILTPYFWNLFFSLADNQYLFYDYFRSPLLAMPAYIFNEPGPGEHPFNLHSFCHQFSLAVGALRDTWVCPNVEVNIARTGPFVLGLSDEEYKFLPLWAGGLDDGTGGVYQSEIPDAERGFPTGPGPSFRTGETIDDSGYDGDTADETATIATGTGTVTMTGGYSFMAAPSQTTGTGHEGDKMSALKTAASGLVLTTAQGSTAASGAGEKETTPTPIGSTDDFDWLSDGSDDLDKLDDFDFDFDDDDPRAEN